MNQSELLAITCNLLKARQKLRVQDAICYGFGSHWLKNWRETFNFRQLFENYLLLTINDIK